MAERTKGKCKYCGKPFTGSYMGKHLASCKARMHHLEVPPEPDQALQGYFLIKVFGTYNKEYWMYIEIDEDQTLGEDLVHIS